MERLKRISIVLGCVALILAIFVPAALAAPPLILGSQQLTDDAGAISSSDEAAVIEALDTLNTEHDIQLFVVYVASFDGLDSGEWANQTADLKAKAASAKAD